MAQAEAVAAQLDSHAAALEPWALSPGGAFGGGGNGAALLVEDPTEWLLREALLRLLDSRADGAADVAVHAF
jgi:hypothetical protein